MLLFIILGRGTNEPMGQFTITGTNPRGVYLRVVLLLERLENGVIDRDRGSVQWRDNERESE